MNLTPLLLAALVPLTAQAQSSFPLKISATRLDFYIPARRAFEEGHYEPGTCPLEPGCGELLVQAAVKLLNELKR